MIGQNRNNSAQINRSRYAFAWPVFLVLALLCSQLVTIEHQHEGDLSNHLDCSICVKQANETHFLVPSDSILPILKFTSAVRSSTQLAVSLSVLSANSRASPVL
jgi:hypothetical protein